MIEIIRDGEPKQQESKLAAAVFECDEEVWESPPGGLSQSFSGA